MAFPQGCSFRNTLAYVSDGTHDFGFFGITASPYPITTTQGNVAGWESSVAGTGAANRSTTNDHRLSGINYVPNDGAGSATFRIDLPAAGTYNIRFAGGDASGQQLITAEIFDNTTSLGQMANGVSTVSANHFVDATGTVLTAANWPGSNTAITKTFSSTICRLKIGPKATSLSNTVAYFYIEAAVTGNSIAVPAATLTITGFAPTVAATTSNSIAVPAGALALTGYAPTIVGSGSQSIAVPAGALALTAYAPSIDQSYINTNVALQANGGTATASDNDGGTYTPDLANDGTVGNSYTGSGFWSSSAGPPQWLQVVFNASYAIEKVVIYGTQDGTVTQTPSPTLTGSHEPYNFTIQGWNGSTWDTLSTVTSNLLVVKPCTFSAYTTDRVRINITEQSGPCSVAELQAYSVNVSGGNSVAVPAGNLTLTGFVPTVAATANQAVAVPAGSLALTGQVPVVTVSNNQSVAVPAGSLAITGQVPMVVASDLQAVAVPAGSFTLTGFIPTVSATANQAVAIPLATLALAAQVPVVTASNSQAVLVPLATLSLTGFAPVVAATANQVVPVPFAALALTGIAPVVVTTANQGVAVPLATLALTSYAPAIAVSGGQTVSVPVAALSLTACVPVVSATAAQAIAVPAAALTLTTQTPVVFASNLQQVSVPAAAITLTAVAPDVSATANMEVDVPLTSLAMTALAPDVAASINISVDVPPASMTLTAYAPSVSFGGDQSVLVPVATLNMVAIAPDISFGVSGGGWSYKRKLRRDEIEALMERERMLAKLYALSEPAKQPATEAAEIVAATGVAAVAEPAKQPASMLAELRRLRATIAAGRVAVPGNKPTQAVTLHDNKADVTVPVGDKTSPVAAPEQRESLSARHARQREEEKLVEAAIEFYYSVAA